MKHPHFWAGDKRWSMEEDLSHPELYNLGHMVEGCRGSLAGLEGAGPAASSSISPSAMPTAWFGGWSQPRTGLRGTGTSDCRNGTLQASISLQATRNISKRLSSSSTIRGKTSIKQEYSQSHKPVLEQDEAVGHAVRATYMYAGMADVAALTGDTAYIHAIDRIWDNIVSKKLYITGGIGATNNGEAFGKNYELPNMSAYCETCAAIGNVYVNYRLFLLHGESKYYDVLSVPSTMVSSVV